MNRAVGMGPAGQMGSIGALQVYGNSRSDLMSFLRRKALPAGRADVLSALESAMDCVWVQLRGRVSLIKRYSTIPPVFGERDPLIQVFSTLLAHAAAQSTGLGAEVRISTTVNNEWVNIEISNNGLRPAEGQASNGLGIDYSLATSRNIVHSLKGRLTMEIGHEWESKVRVSLPVAVPQYAEHAVRTFSRPTVHTARVLVIDDEPKFGRTLALALGENYTVDSVTEGIQALSRLEEDSSYDLILLDMKLPGMTGEQVYEAIANQHPALKHRVVFMSGSPMAMSYLHPLGLTVQKLEKPFRVEQVESILNALG